MSFFDRDRMDVPRVPVLSALLCSTMLVPPSMAQAQTSIIPDGRTNTAVTTSGALSDVRTGTVHGAVGFNSFKEFNVGAGATVNVHVPQGATTTINLVRDRATRVDGVLNSITAGGTVGGNMIVANPNGVIVGAGGRINAGNVSLSTPSQAFVDGFFGADGTPNAQATRDLLDGTAAQSGADIRIEGQITSASGVRLRAGGDVTLSGSAARAAHVSAFANTGGLATIDLSAARDVVVQDGATATARSGADGDTITVRAGRDAVIEGALDTSATGDGDGGRVALKADRAATLTSTGSVTARAPGRGDGGDIAFSGLKTVTLSGEITAAATDPNAARGSLYIDPEILRITEDQIYDGQDTILEATDRIEIVGAVLTTRKTIADPGGANLEFLQATGDAGDLTLRAPIIEIVNGSKLLANGGFDTSTGTLRQGGTVTLEAVSTATLDQAGIATSVARITLGDEVAILGASVVIRAEATTTLSVTEIDETASLGSATTPSDISSLINETAQIVTGELASRGVTLLPARITATAEITSSATKIQGQDGAVSITAHATTDATVKPQSNMIAAVGVQSDTTATIALRTAYVNNASGGFEATQDIRGTTSTLIEAKTTERADLTARAEQPDTGAAVAILASDRTSRATVLFEARSAFGGVTRVSIAEDPVIRALSVRDITLDATAITGGSGAALAGIASLQDGLAAVAGGASYNGSNGAGLTIEAETRWDTFAATAQGITGRSDLLTGGTVQGDAAGALSQTRDAGSAVEVMGDLEGAAVTGAGIADIAALSGGFVLNDHDDETIASTSQALTANFNTLGGRANFGGINITDLGADFDAQPVPAGDVTLSARTVLNDIAVQGRAETTGTTGALVAGSVTNWGMNTAATLENVFASAEGKVTVLAETILPGSGSTASDLTSIGTLDGGSLTAASVLPSFDTLLPADRARFTSEVVGPSDFTGVIASGSFVTMDVRTEARITDDVGIEGVTFFDYSCYDDPTATCDDPEAFFQAGVHVIARTAGALENTANDPTADGVVPTVGTGLGAGVAVTNVTSRMLADMQGRANTHDLEVRAENGFDLGTRALAGGGDTVSLAGAFALTNLVTETYAQHTPYGDRFVRFDPAQVEADRNPDGPMRVLAIDDTRVVTLGGVAQQDGAVASIGASAAINRVDRNTAAALGDTFELAYEGLTDRPFVFDQTPPTPVFGGPGSGYDQVTIRAQTTNAVIAAARAGAAPSDTATDGQDSVRSAPKQAGGVDIEGDTILTTETVQTADEDNATEGATGGFGLSGAFAASSGTVRTRAYIGQLGDFAVEGSLTVEALDQSGDITLAGAIAPGDTTVGLAGAMARNATMRDAGVTLYGGTLTATRIDVTAATQGRTVTLASGTGGEGVSAASLAGSFALAEGARRSSVTLASVQMTATDRAVSLTADTGGEVLTVAGASEESGAAFGLGAAVALDRSDVMATVETRTVPGNTDLGLPAPSGLVALSAATNVNMTAKTTATRTALARSTGTATGFALSGSGALMNGTRRATVRLDSDVALPIGATVLAEAGGTSLAQSGADVTADQVGFGIAFARQAEARTAQIDLGARRIGGLSGGMLQGVAGALDLTAQVSGDVTAKSIAGAKPAAGEDANPLALNGSVALNDAHITAQVAGDRGTGHALINGGVVNITARTDAMFKRQSDAGGQTAAGDGIGFGLGFALDTGRTDVLLDMTSVRLNAGIVTARAEDRGTVSAQAVNGSTEGGLNIGVNIAGVDATTDVVLKHGAFGALADDNNDEISATKLTLEALARGTETAQAKSVNPTDADANSIAVGLGGIRSTVTARVDLGLTDIDATGAINVTAQAAPTRTTRSDGADGIRVDFGAVGDGTDADGKATDSGGFNLSAAAALTDADTRAFVTVTGTDMRTAAALDVGSTAQGTSSAAGLMAAQAETVVSGGAILVGESTTVSSSAAATVIVTGKGDRTNAGAEARAKDDETATLVDSASNAAKGEEADRSAFAASITPESAQAGAKTRVEEAVVASTSRTDISSEAVTDVTLGATDAPVSVVVAITQTDAETVVQNASVGGSGALDIKATMTERQSLTARVPTDSSNVVDVAGIVSIRKGSAVALVDNRVANTGLYARDIDVRATTNRVLNFDATANTGETGFLSVAGVVGFGSTVTSAAVGGTVADSAGTGAADSFDVTATATTDLTVTALATSGTATAPKQDGEDATGGSAVGTALITEADETREESKSDDDARQADGTIADAVRIALGVTILGQDDRVDATIGGTALTHDGTQALGATSVTATDVSVTALSEIAAMKLRTNSFLGNRPDAGPSGFAASGAVTYTGFDLDTRATLGDTGTVTGTALTIAARTRLDPDAAASQAAALAVPGSGADVSDSFDVTPAQKSPSLGTLIEDDKWSISQGAAAVAEDASIGVDVGILNLDLNTQATAEGTATTGQITVEAEAARGLSLQVGRASPLADIPGSGAGLGGSVAITLLDEETLAQITDGANLTTTNGPVSVISGSDLRIMVQALSKGAATDDFAFNGALGLAYLDRNVLADVEARGTIDADVIVTATDTGEFVNAAISQAISGGLSFGVGVAMTFGEALTRAGMAVSGARDVTVTATDSATVATSAAAGSGSDAADENGGLFGGFGVGSVFGADVTDADETAQSGKTDEAGGADASDYGVGFSGAFAANFGTQTAQAHVVGSIADKITATATADGTVLTAAGGIVEGSDTNGIAGAAALNTRQGTVLANVEATTAAGDITIGATGARKLRTLSSGTTGYSTGDFSVAGSASLDLSDQETTAQLVGATISSEIATTRPDVAITATSMGDTTTLAGAEVQGEGTAIGLSYAQQSGTVETQANIVGGVIYADTVAIAAQTLRTRTARSLTRAITSNDSPVSITAAATLLTGSTDADANIRKNAEIWVAEGLSVTARGRAQGNAPEGNTTASATQLDVTTGTSTPQVGGAFALIATDRQITAEVVDSFVVFEGGDLETGKGTTPVGVIQAEDGARTRVWTAGLRGGSATQVSGNSALAVTTGDVAARVGRPQEGPIAPGNVTGIAFFDNQGTLEVTAEDARDVEALTGDGGLTLGSGTQVAVGGAGVFDTRNTVARVEDVVLGGTGLLDVTAQRSGDLSAQAAFGAGNAGGTAVSVNGAATFAGGSVSADAIGLQHQSIDEEQFGAITVRAEDTGDVSTDLLNIGGTLSGTNVGAATVLTFLSRDVTAGIGDSSQAVMDLVARGEMTAIARGASTIDAVANRFGGAGSIDVGATVRLMSSDRDITAGIFGEVDARGATVVATRDDIIDAIGVSASLSGGGSAGGRFTLASQSGATDAILRLDDGSAIGDLGATITATDESRITARSFAATLTSGFSAFGDVMIVEQGGAAAPEAADDGSDRFELREVDTLRTGAAGQADTLTTQLFDTRATPTPLAAPTQNGQTRAAVEGEADEARIDGDLDVTARTHSDLTVIGGDISVSGGVSAGAVATLALRRTQTVAEAAMTGALDVNGRASLIADTRGDTTATSFGLSVSGSTAAAGSVAVSVDERGSRVTLGSTLQAGEVDALAQTSGDTNAIGLIGAAGSNAAVGVGLAVAVDGRTVTAEATDHIRTTATDLSITAQGAGATRAVAVSAGVAGTAGVAGAVSVATQRMTVLAKADAARLDAAADLNIHARATDFDGEGPDSGPSVTAVVVPIALGGTAAVGASSAVAVRRGSTQALSTNSLLSAGDDIELRAQADVALDTVSVGATGGGTAGVGGSVAISVRDDVVRARSDGSTITADDSVVVQANASTGNIARGGQAERPDQDSTNDIPADGYDPGGSLKSVGVNVAFGGVAGVGISVAVPVTTATVEAIIDNGSNVTALGMAGGGRDASPLILRGDINADGSRRTIAQRGVSVIADSALTYDAVAVTAAVGGIAGVAAQVNVLTASDTVEARIGDTGARRTDVTAQGVGADVTVRATGSMDILSVNVAGGGGGKVGAGAVSNTLVLDREITADITDAYVTAQDDITVEAIAAERVRSVDVAAGIGLFAGVAGGVTVVMGESDISARVTEARLTAQDDIDINAAMTRDTGLFLAGAGAGIGAVTGAVMVVDSADRVEAVVSDAASSSTATILDGDAVGITADLDQTVSLDAASIAGGVVAIQGTVVVAQNDGTSIARLGTHTVAGTMAKRVGSLTVTADQSFDGGDPGQEIIRTGALGLSAGSIGGVMSLLSANAVTEATIGAQANVVATGPVTVAAQTVRDVRTSAHSVQIAGIMAFTGVVSMTSLGEALGNSDTEPGGRDVGATDQLLDIGSGLSADNLMTQTDGEATYDVLDTGLTGAGSVDTATTKRRDIGGDLTAAAAATTATPDADRTVARVENGAAIRSAGDVSIAADDLTQAGAVAGGLNLSGFVAANAGFARTSVASTVEADIGAATIDADGAVDITAGAGNESRAADTSAKSFSGQVSGGVAIGAAAARVDQRRMVVAQVDAAATISGDAGTYAGNSGVAAQVTGDTTADVAAFDGALFVAANEVEAKVVDTSVIRAQSQGDFTAQEIVIEASADGVTSATAAAGALAFLGTGSTVSAVTVDTSEVSARLSGTINAARTVIARARDGRDAVATAFGLSYAPIGLAFAGVTAQTDASRTILAEIEDGAAVKSRFVTVASTLDDITVSADAFSGAGGLGLGDAGATATATLGGTNTAALNASSIDASTRTQVRADSTQTVGATGTAGFFGLTVGGGASKATVRSVIETDADVNTAGRAGDMRIAATTDETLQAGSIGAAGSGVATAASEATIDGRSNTQSEIRTRAGGITANSLSAGVQHVVDVSPSANSATVGIVGEGAAVAKAKVLTTSGLDFASSADVTVGAAALSSIVDIRDQNGGRTAIAGAGGGFSNTGAASDIEIAVDNGIHLNRDAILRQRGSGGAVDIQVASQAEGLGSVRIATLEVASRPVGRSVVEVRNGAALTLGLDAQIDAQGDVTASVGSGGGAQAISNVATSGGGSRISTRADADYQGIDQIGLSTGARIAGADVTLSTGTLPDGARAIDVDAQATYRSGSLVPLDKVPEASAEVRADSRISIATGASIDGQGTVRLDTTRGLTDLDAVARGRNIYLETGEAILDGIADFIGLDVDVDLDVVGPQTTVMTENAGVTLNGAVRSGLGSNVFIRLDSGGVFRALDGSAVDAADVPAELRSVTVPALRASLLGGLEDQRDAYRDAGEGGLADLLDLQILEIALQLDVLENQVGSGTVEVLFVDPITVDAADILISGGYLTGAGTLAANTDIGVTVDVAAPNTASAPRTITVLDAISVPDVPGSVYLDGIRVANNRAVGDVNAQDARRAQRNARGGPQTATVFTSETQNLTAPTLTFESVAGNGSAQVDVSSAGDLFAFGNIVNRAGDVRLASLGNVMLQGNVIARSVDVQAGGSVLVGLAPGLRSIGPDVQARLFDRGALPDLLDNELSNSGTQAFFTQADLAQDTPAIQAQNVSIYGEFINVNGRIEAGGPAMDLDIDAGLDTYLDTVLIPALQAEYDAQNPGDSIALLTGAQATFGGLSDLVATNGAVPTILDYLGANFEAGTGLPDRILLHDPTNPDTARTGITGDIAVYYNANLDRLEFDPIVASGGQVKLAGEIVSTGNGAITVLDGFANIDIDSNSTRDLRFDEVDTGGEAGVAGRVEIIDLRKPLSATASDIRNRFATTVYEGVDHDYGQGTVRTIRTTRTTGNQPSIQLAPSSELRQSSYEIASDQTSNNSLIGMPYLTYEVRATHAGTTANQQTREVLTPGAAGTNFDDAVVDRRGETRDYIYQRSPLGNIDANGSYTHTHSFRADRDIAINFVGDRAGSVAIDAQGGVDLTQAVRSAGAEVTIAATGAITGVGPNALIDGAYIDLETRSAAAISGGANAALQLNNRSVSGVPSDLSQQGIFVRAETGTSTVEDWAPVLLEARSGDLRIKRVQGSRVSLAAQGDILRSNGASAQATVASRTGLDLNSREGAVGAASLSNQRFIIETGSGVLSADAQDSIVLFHNTVNGADLRVERLETRGTVNALNSLSGDVRLETDARIVDANDRGFADVTTEETALAAFWTQVGALGDEQDATIAALEDAEAARRRAAYDRYWAERQANGSDPGAAYSVGLSADEQAAIRAASADTAEADLAISEAQEERQALYILGRDIQGQVGNPNAGQAGNVTLRPDVDPTARPTLTAALDTALEATAADKAAIDDGFNITASDLDIGLRSDYVIRTTDTQIDVEEANIAATGDVYISAADVGEDQFLAQVQALGAGLPPLTEGQLFELDKTSIIPRDLLVLLATSERDDVQRLTLADGTPLLRIFGAEDLDIDAGGSVIVEAGGQNAKDPRAFIGSEGSLTLDRISADDRVRIKVAGAIIGADTSDFGVPSANVHVTGRDIILEAATGSIGTAGEALKLNSSTPGGDVTVEARAAGDIFLQREVAGDINVAAILAGGDASVQLGYRDQRGVEQAVGDIRGADALAFVEGNRVTLTASGAIGSPILQLGDTKSPLEIRSTGKVVAEAGTGLVISSPGTLTVQSLGSADGKVEVIVEQGDLLLDGLRVDTSTPNSVQFQPTIFAAIDDTIILDVQTGQVLDLGSDVASATGFRQPDIYGGDLNLFVDGFGLSSDYIETDVASVRGAAYTQGLYLSNDRRLSGASGQAGWVEGLGIQDIATGDGDLNVFSNGGFVFEGGTIRAQTAQFTGITGDSTIDGTVRHFGDDFIVDLGAYDLRLTGRQDLRSEGNITLDVGTLTVDGFNVPVSTRATASSDGNILAGGNLTIEVNDNISARRLGGQNVTVMAEELPGLTPAVQRPAATALIGRVDATGDALIDVTGAATLNDVNVGGAVRFDLGGVTNDTLRVDAAEVKGNIRALPTDFVLELAGSSTLDGLILGGFQTTGSIRALNGVLTIGALDGLRMGSGFIEAGALDVQGELTADDLAVRTTGDIRVGADAHISGTALTLHAGAIASPDRKSPPNIDMDATARMTSQSTLALTTAGTASVTGLNARTRQAGTIGIDIDAGVFRDAGDSLIDLSTNDGVTARIRATDSQMSYPTGIETQIGGLDAEFVSGNILLREVDDLIVQSAITGAGVIDIFGFGDIQLNGKSAGANGTPPTLRATGVRVPSVVITAHEGLYTEAGKEVIIDAPQVYLGAIEGSVGTSAQSFDIRQGDTTDFDIFSLTAGRHIVGRVDGNISAIPMIAADTGLIDLKVDSGEPSLISSPLSIDILGLDRNADPQNGGVYDTLPSVIEVLEAAQYPLREARAPGAEGENGPVADTTGLTATFGTDLPTRTTGSDGATGDPVSFDPDQPISTPTPVIIAQEIAAKRTRTRIVQNSGGEGEEVTSPAFTPGNPLQPQGSEMNRLVTGRFFLNTEEGEGGTSNGRNTEIEIEEEN